MMGPLLRLFFRSCDAWEADALRLTEAAPALLRADAARGRRGSFGGAARKQRGEGLQRRHVNELAVRLAVVPLRLLACTRQRPPAGALHLARAHPRRHHGQRRDSADRVRVRILFLALGTLLLIEELHLRREGPSSVMATSATRRPREVRFQRSNSDAGKATIKYRVVGQKAPQPPITAGQVPS